MTKVRSEISPNLVTLLMGYLLQRTLTYFIRGNITIWLTSCLTGWDLAKQANMFVVSIQKNS